MRILILASLCICVALAFAAPAMAESLVLDQHFGEVDASGSLTITFTNDGANRVLVTMDAGGLSESGEFIHDWYFNFDDTSFTGNATNLAFSDSDTEDVSGFDNLTIIQHSAQDLQADGDGKYNLRVQFVTANSDDDDRFEAGDSVSFLITGTGISASDFMLIAVKGGGNGPFYSAAHVQVTGTDDQGSDWLGAYLPPSDPPAGVPEPTSIALLGLGFAGLVGLRRRRRRD